MPTKKKISKDPKDPRVKDQDDEEPLEQKKPLKEPKKELKRASDKKKKFEEEKSPEGEKSPEKEKIPPKKKIPKKGKISPERKPEKSPEGERKPEGGKSPKKSPAKKKIPKKGKISPERSPKSILNPKPLSSSDVFSKDNIFIAKTKEAYPIRIAIELHQNYIKDGEFRISKSGIQITGIDTKNTITIRFDLMAENFLKYIYRLKHDYVFTVNLVSLAKLMKTIKKKDSIVLFIQRDGKNLGIQVHQGEEIKKTITGLPIKVVQPREIVLPGDYPPAINISSREFQKLCKDMAPVSKTIEVYSKGGNIRFFCDGDNLYSRTIFFGDDENEDESGDESGEEKETIEDSLKDFELSEPGEEYRQSFAIHKIILLTKVASLSPIVYISTMTGSPLKIKMRIGTLGDMLIFIKSDEELDKEEGSDREDDS